MKCSDVKELFRGNVPDRFKEQFSTEPSSTTLVPTHTDASDIDIATGTTTPTPWTDLSSFVQHRMSVEACVTRNTSLLMTEARKHRCVHRTTQHKYSWQY